MVQLNVLKHMFGSRNQRILKQLQKNVNKINSLESMYEKQTDDELKANTASFKQRLSQGESLDHILPEAFAVVREASKRTIGLRHFDVQLKGGMILHQGKIAEMRTGEGKTLVATLALYLNALSGEGAHLVTVNDYLASRDAEQMGKIYSALGMTTGVILSEMDPAARKEAYAADITYGTNNEFGFDYLRDNMAFSVEEQVQRTLNFAVVDEVDSILIDEARTPLIISGVGEGSVDYYKTLNAMMPKLKARKKEDGPGDYYLDEKNKQAYLTDEGHEKMEKLLQKGDLLAKGESLYSASNITLMHFLNACLRANTLFQKDVDYMVKEGEILIVDEHTGRAMPGRRWSDGLHQAIEAKENVDIQAENQTLAAITFQNYFRHYNKLSGMTGTADTEAYEFHQIYNLEVVVIPTHMPMVRKDHADTIFLTMQEKFNAIVKDIKTSVAKKQPVLVGTASIEASEHLAILLNKAKIKHSVLNAKQHAKEATIIAQAGSAGAVTIATNMAGRGTDIVLGGNLQAEIAALDAPSDNQIAKLTRDWQARHDTVVKAGGLRIIGSERHESRRIDNQLRGRSGRQGDPGASRFYLSLDDNLVRIFASDRMAAMMKKLGMGDGEALESKMISKAIENAQKKVENHNFDMRKHLLEYDDVANEQRKVIYTQRQELLEAKDVTDIVVNMREDVIRQLVDAHIPPDSLEEQWDVSGLEATLKEDFDLALPIKKWLAEDDALNADAVYKKVQQALLEVYAQKKERVDDNILEEFEKTVVLQTIDSFWREHLANIDHLRNSINLRGYAQKDPKQEYKRESFNLFADMLDNFKYEVINILSKVEIREQEQVNAAQDQWRNTMGTMNFQHAELNTLNEEAPIDVGEIESDDTHTPFVREGRKIGRNEPCPCGSGKKYKACHGQL